jgi:hypothetical protein
MRRQLQISGGIAHASWSGSGSMPVPPDVSWTFLDVTDRPDAECGMAYDAETDTFSRPSPPVRTRVTKSQVISVLTPAEWANATTSTDADVIWGMAQFTLADYVDLADARFGQIFGALVAKGIVTEARAAQIQTHLMALANG